MLTQAKGFCEISDNPIVSNLGNRVSFGLESLDLVFDGDDRFQWDELESIGTGYSFDLLDLSDGSIALEVTLPMPDGLFGHTHPYFFEEWRHWSGDRPSLGEIDVGDIEALLNDPRPDGGGSAVGPEGWDSWPEDIIGSGVIAAFVSIPEPTIPSLLLLGMCWLFVFRTR